MLPAAHNPTKVQQVASGRASMYRMTVAREGVVMDIIEPTSKSTANAKKHCVPCNNSMDDHNVLKCNFHGCKCRIAAPFVKTCPKGEF